MGKSHSKRNKKKTSGELVMENCLNPNAKSVVQNVNIACKINETDAQPSTSKIHNKKDEDDDVWTSKLDTEEATITSTLKNLYEKIALPCVPWIQRTHMPMNLFTKLQLNSDDYQWTTKDIELHNLFDAVNKRNPRRILIEAQPGFGKTSLTHKIISDWVNEESYVKRFKFAFLVILRNCKSSTVKNEIFNIIGFGNHAEDKMWKIINSEETLLILDGLDEVSENVKKDILGIVYDEKNEYKMTIVTTCRVGLSQLKIQEKDDSKLSGISMRNEFWSKKITIIGINSDDGKQFLSNFVEDAYKDKIMPRLMEIINSKEEMFKSPLMLILLVYLMYEDDEIKIKNNTDLYKQFVDCIIRRSIAKDDPAKAIPKFTLFDSSVNKYSSTFYKFGEMCWEHILNDELQFDSNDDTEAIHQLGFILKHVTSKRFEISVHYEGFHLSILEFAAAVFLKKEFQDNHNRFCDSLIEKIVEICVKKGSFSLLIPFLCGLLGNDHVASFFDQLSDNHGKYWMDEELIESILREFEMNESIIEYFRKIVPPYAKIYSIPSALVTVMNQYSGNFLDIINIDFQCLVQITQPLHVRVLICRVRNTGHDIVITDADVSKAGENITCDYLIFCISDSAYETFISSLKLFEKISSNDKTLRIYRISAEARKSLQKSAYEKMIRGVKFNLFADIFRNIEVKVITKIIKFNRVTNVCLVTHVCLKARYKHDVYRSLGNTNTNTLCIINEDHYLFNLNFDTITKNAGKKWEYLLFSDLKLKCKAQVNSIRHVKSLSINANSSHKSSMVDDANVMLSVVPTALRCKSRALELLNNDRKADVWDGWDEIEELTLSMDEPISEECARGFNNFSRFKNLKTLKLEIFQKHYGRLDLTNIIKSISLLTLVRLEIRWWNMDYYEEIILEIQNLVVKNKNIHAIVLTIMWEQKYNFSDGQFNLKLIKSVLQCDDRISFTFYFLHWSDLRSFVRRFIHDLSCLNVKYGLIESGYASTFGQKFRHFDKLELTLRK